MRVGMEMGMRIGEKEEEDENDAHSHIHTYLHSLSPLLFSFFSFLFYRINQFVTLSVCFSASLFCQSVSLSVRQSVSL